MSEHGSWKKGDIVERRSGTIVGRCEVLDKARDFSVSKLYIVEWEDGAIEKTFPMGNDRVVSNVSNHVRLQEEENDRLRVENERLKREIVRLDTEIAEMVLAHGGGES